MHSLKSAPFGIRLEAGFEFESVCSPHANLAVICVVAKSTARAMTAPKMVGLDSAMCSEQALKIEDSEGNATYNNTTHALKIHKQMLVF